MATILTAWFMVDMNILCAGKGVTVPATPVVRKRMDANLHVQLNGTLPALCVYGRGATTQASVESRRDNTSAVSVDYFDRQDEATLPTLLAQAELAVEAILKGIDRMGQDSTTGVWGAALPENSAVVTMGDFENAPDGLYQRLATVTFQVNDRDEVPWA